MRYIHTTPEKWEHLKGYCRDNRKQQTHAEKIAWSIVRNSHLGYRVRRQHAFENFIIDFICIEKKIVIEIDGESHQDQQEYDAWRTSMLEELGAKSSDFLMMRFVATLI